MPPFITTRCPYCARPNRYDLAELQAEEKIYKSMILRTQKGLKEELSVTCQHADCGKQFKIEIPPGIREGGSHA